MVAATQSQQALLDAGVGVQRGEVEMMVMESLDPTLIQMKAEVVDLHLFSTEVIRLLLTKNTLWSV